MRVESDSFAVCSEHIIDLILSFLKTRRIIRKGDKFVFILADRGIEAEQVGVFFTICVIAVTEFKYLSVLVPEINIPGIIVFDLLLEVT